MTSFISVVAYSYWY